jgi:hypothetical protein
MLIDVQLLVAIHVILPPAPSVFQESSDAAVYTRGSVRRASGFVLTGHSGLSISPLLVPSLTPGIPVCSRLESGAECRLALCVPLEPRRGKS